MDPQPLVLTVLGGQVVHPYYLRCAEAVVLVHHKAQVLWGGRCQRGGSLQGARCWSCGRCWVEWPMLDRHDGMPEDG